MVELPFGKYPFARKPTPSSGINTNKAAPSTIPVSRAPPLLINPRNKRNINHTTGNDPVKGEASKKNKTVPLDAPYTASLVFGDITKENFKDEDVVN